MDRDKKVTNNIDYIVWYADIDKLDFKDPWVKKWWIQQVLIHGRIEDIKKLDFEEIKKLLPAFHMDYKIKSLWEDYFARRYANINEFT